jgi:3D (Asp-Asp-Asp) domain-containing protein
LFKLKTHMIRVYMLLEICFMGIGMCCLNIESKSIEINKHVAGKYQGSSKIENNDIEELKDVVEEDTTEEYIESSSDKSNDVPVETEVHENTSTQSQENQHSAGMPIKAELTAYCNDPRCSDEWGSQTAMQTRTRLGVIAAPSNIPFGSKIYISELKNYKADGMFDVEDRGGAIKVKEDGTYVIDVWLPTYEEAEQFGRKKTTIYLVDKY